MITLILLAVAAPVALAAAYLALLSLFSRALRPLPRAKGTPRFLVVVPAHDEEAGIARTVSNLLGLDYPRDAVRVLVVADNCSDATADAAAAAGAEVLVRNDAQRRGKGYALEVAFERMVESGEADAAVVVDADTLASRNLLQVFAARIEAGAEAAQAHYGVQNPETSWRTRLMHLALTLFHGVRSVARERLRLSCGLRGNGMCFTRALLARIPHRAFSLVEDVEYGARLAEAGVRVHYAGDAEVLGEMVSGERASRSQRQRWEDGRKQLARTLGRRLLMTGFSRRDPLLLDVGADLLVPPLSRLAATTFLGLVLSAVSARSGRSPLPLWIFGCAALALGAYVGRGWVLAGTGARGLLDLLQVPRYVLWKAALALRKPASREWVRTAREERAP